MQSKPYWVVGGFVLLLLAASLIRVFPPSGGCPAFPGTDCKLNKQSAIEYFLIRGGTLQDLKYIKEYERNQEQANQALEGFLQEQNDMLPEISLGQIRQELQKAITNNTQNITIGKYNGIPVVIQRSGEPPVWKALYVSGERVTPEQCEKLSGTTLNFSGGSYEGCSPLPE